jgi:hypothetical protein
LVSITDPRVAAFVAEDRPAPSRRDIALDCEVLTVAGHDIRIVVFAASPGTSDADKLDLLRVIGVQDFTVRYVDTTRAYRSLCR